MIPHLVLPVGQEPNSEDLFNDNEVSDRNVIAAAEKFTGPTVDCRTQPSQSQEYDEQPLDNQQNLPSFPATFGKSSTSAMAAVNGDTVARKKDNYSSTRHKYKYADNHEISTSQHWKCIIRN